MLFRSQRVPQDLPRIDAAIADGSFSRLPALQDALRSARQSGLHIVTLLGDGGVHANDRHAIELLRAADAAGVQRILVHLLLDGRDTPPRSAATSLESFCRRMAEVAPQAQIATVGGRYYGMDRDGRWERTAAAVNAMVLDDAPFAPSPHAVIDEAYARGESDEFVAPARVALRDAKLPRFTSTDVVIHASFRAEIGRAHV